VRTITIANQKGGCGKTTVAINLSASFAREGRRILLIDLDPQAHCALGMAVPEEQIDLSILDCLLPQNDGEPLELSRITWQIAPNLDLAPSRSNLATLEPRMGTRKDAETLLRDLLKANAGRYDYCFIDCPPHMGLLMKNGLRAGDEVVIPVDTGYFSLHGLTQQLATIEQLGERNGVNPSVRILANQYDVRTKLAREILGEMRKRFPGLVYETIVNFNTKLKEGASFGQPITEFAPNSMGARDFQKLAREIMASEPHQTPTADILEHVEKLAADAERLLATTTTLVDNRPPEAAQTPPAGQVPISPPHDVPELLPPAGSEGQTGSLPAPTPVVASSRPAIRESGAESDTTLIPPWAPDRHMTSPSRWDPATTQSVTEATPEPRVVGDAVGQGGPIPPAASSIPEIAPPSAQNLVGAEATGQPTRTAPPSTPASDAEIDRKIEAIYGVRQEGELLVFRSHNPEASEVQLAGDFNDWMPHSTTPWSRPTSTAS
jgi:chromosome partitioning protein